MGGSCVRLKYISKFILSKLFLDCTFKMSIFLFMVVVLISLVGFLLGEWSFYKIFFLIRKN